jgi:hypothetical protein
MWVEYLRWLQQQSQLFLRPAYTEEGIAELLDSDGDNEIIDEYDQLTRQGTVEPEHGPFQNYVVFIFSYFNCLLTLKSKFLIITNAAQVTQLGQLENEASDALRHSPNSVTSYNALRAFIEVSMVSISLIHLNISLNYLYCRLFLCRGSARVLDDWHFAATASEPSMWPIRFHRLPQYVGSKESEPWSCNTPCL